MEGEVETWKHTTTARKASIDGRALSQASQVLWESSARPLYTFHLAVNLLPWFSGAQCLIRRSCFVHGRSARSHASPKECILHTFLLIIT